MKKSIQARLTQINAGAKKAAARVAAVVGTVTVAAGNAMAALPTEAATAMETAKTDTVTAATSFLLGGIAFWAVRVLGKKFGWWL